jgi:haloacetate dehalogenase
MFSGFEPFSVAVDGVVLRGRRSPPGKPPLLLLHGHPQTHVMWHRVAPGLAARFEVIAADLRGYGDSDRPPPDADHAAYSKRRMAADALALMAHFGHARFGVLAHDRGARVAHRLALDHPQAVSRLLLLDIAPTLAMYEHTGEVFARAYWHWFFLIQPAPLPERLIEADPAAYLRDVMGRRSGGLAVFAPEALAAYERCIARPGSAAAICEDYRASATLDLEHDRADRAAGRRVQAPLHVLWGERGVVCACFDVPALWREAAARFSGRAVPAGHYIAEEQPALLVAETVGFFQQESE